MTGVDPDRHARAGQDSGPPFGGSSRDGARNRAGRGDQPRSELIALPAQWPSAWPYLRAAAYQRMVFVLAVAVLTAAGIVLAGDLATEWWVPILPAALLAGPVLRPGRVRRRLRRAAVDGRLAVMPGRVHPGPVTSRGQTVRLVTDAGDAVRVPVGRGVAEALAMRHLGARALLVWVPGMTGLTGRTVRGPAALVLGRSRLAYLDHVPRGARNVTTRTHVVSDSGTLVPPRT